MRKKTMSVMLTVLIAAIFIGLFAFLAWGTNWFSSTARLRKLFGDESVTAAAHVSDGSMTVGARNTGVIHDSEDATAAVSVKYVNPPHITSTGKDIHIFNSHHDVPGQYVEVYIGTSPSYVMKTFTFENERPNVTGYSGSLGFYNQHYISYQEIRDVIGENNDYFIVWAKVLQYGEYLSKTTSYYSFYAVGEPLEFSLTGATLTCVVPDRVVVGSSSNSFGINFFDGNGTRIAEADSSKCTLSDHTYTVDLTQFDFINTPTDCINVIPYFHFLNDSRSYIMDCPEFFFSIIKLDTPTNIKYESGVLSWNAVENAQGYKIFIGDDDATGTVLTDTQYDFHGKPVGNYNVRIRALGNVGAALASSARMTAFNASLNVQQVVALSYVVGDDTVTKFVPHGSKFSDVSYEVVNPEYEFGGWFYDSGYSVRVLSTDEITADTTIYARLSDVEVTERPLTWWEKHKWQVLIPCFVVGGLLIIGAVAFALKKRKGGE